MNPTAPSSAAPRRLRHRLASLLGAALVLLAACGGGVEGQGTGSFGFSQGAITGYGSIVVNGVHYDESAATVLADDGQTALRPENLLLGMTVEVHSGAVDPATLTAVAQSVRVRSELLGPVSASDLTAGTLTVLGQTVRVTASTVFDSRISGGQAGLSLGQLVEVYAIADPVSGVYAARRIEPVASASQYKIRGTVGSLGSGQFTIGAATFAYSGSPVLSAGQPVRLVLRTALDGAGRYQLASASDDTPQLADGTAAELEGVIASYTSLADFTVAGVRIDAAKATIKPAGSTLAAGSRIEVEGRMVGGVLQAAKLEVKAAEDGGQGGGGSGGGDDGSAVEYEIEGKLVSGSLDTVAQTFRIGSRAQRVAYGAASFTGGTAATLATWTGKVKVKGVIGADGVTVDARQIEFDD